MVIASGPHVLRGMEDYEGHLIAYSLGNFAGYQNFSTDGTLDLGGILTVTLSGEGTFESGNSRRPPSRVWANRPSTPRGPPHRFVNQTLEPGFRRRRVTILPSGQLVLPAAG